MNDPKKTAPSPLDRLLEIVSNPASPDSSPLPPAMWEEVRKLAARHGFTGVLAYKAGAAMPASERPWRDRALMQHHGDYFAKRVLLRRLVEAFAAEGIRCVSLKGPLLAERFYSPPFLKMSGDLDLLIGEADTGRAFRLMQNLGCRLTGKEPWHVHRRQSHHLVFRCGPEETATQVEIHYCLSMTGYMVVPSEEFVERSIPWRAAEGFSANILSPGDEVFYLAVHAATHCFHRLRWLYDAVVAGQSLDKAGQQRVRELVARYRQSGRFIPADMAAREFFGVSLQPGSDGMRRSWLSGLFTPRRIHAMMQRPQSESLTPGQKAGYLLDWCSMSDSLLEAAQIGASIAGYKAARRLYMLRGQPLGPDVLARTIPG